MDDAPDSETHASTPPSQPPVAGGFAPGTVLAERYRIVSLIGRGGMGEVYRADDLRLGQAVALKFLPEAVAHDEAARDRLFSEARHARSISHPNVCRVYDAGEMAGRVFLTMEFIDGEDLASLLRRIGRLPGPKALEIARQLCAGLEAAHERGLLHRDLKPANVMIDGRGHARITDFGLAIDVQRVAAASDFAGTVPYMSPERLNGSPASVQSDVYALGLVLYETFTGKAAFKASTLDEWRAAHGRTAPTRPSQLSNEVDAATERAILLCLEKDPARRPASARGVGALLPGGDPLAAALAAGETPSPELVAASGEEGTLPRGKAWALLVACLASFALAAGAWQWTSLAGLVPFEGSPDVLRAKARTILRDLGHDDIAEDHAWEIAVDYPRLGSLTDTPGEARGFSSIAGAEPTPLSFRYRQSPGELRPLDVAGIVTADDPAPLVPGEASVHLDSLGRLTYLRVLPLTRDRDAAPSAPPDWAPLLAALGLRGVTLQPARPARVPPVIADTRQAWTGTVNGEPVRAEAAAWHGRIFFAEREGSWNEAATGAPAASGGIAVRPAQTALAVMWMITLAVLAVLARRNLRAGRGDRRGAERVAAVVLSLGVINAVIGRHWIADAAWLWTVMSTRLGAALFNAVVVWLLYLGLEPFARRQWPHLLIGWTRLLDARWRDPLVGRALLAGVLFGTIAPIVSTLPETSGRLFGLSGTQPSFWAFSLAPPAIYLSAVGGLLLAGLKNSLGLVAFMVVARFVLRERHAVFVATAVVATIASTSGVAPRALDIAQAVVLGVAAVVFFRKFGLLALVVGLAVNYVIRQTPWTFDVSKWFAWRPGLTCALVVALVAWGFTNVLGRQSALAAPDIDL